MNVCVWKACPTSSRCAAFISHFPYPSFNPSIISTHSFMLSFLLKAANLSCPVLQPLCCFGVGLWASQLKPHQLPQGCSKAPVTNVRAPRYQALNVKLQRLSRPSLFLQWTLTHNRSSANVCVGLIFV